MTATEMLVVVILLLIVIAVLAEPFFRRHREIEEVGELSADAEDLHRRKESTYSALKELEFDFRMGKLSRTDFDELDAKYRAEALQILDAMDSHQSGESELTEGVPDQPGRERSSVRPGRERSSVHSASPREAPEQTAPAQTANVVAVADPKTCECGFELPEGARFCPACGEFLEHPADPFEPDEDGHPLCSVCGAELEWDHRFCAECGAPAC